MIERKWTREQQHGITATGRSLLVSAAAGSGKTAILAARCAHLVCDANPTCEVDELLVVTFTEAAAAEMKSRIHQALRERAKRNPSDRLTRQLALVDQAQVSTLHGFCSRLLREHFHTAGLDPGFEILDGDDAQLLRLEIARDVFRRQYEADDGGEFQRFVDAYGDGDDERLLRRVVGTHELLSSLVDPQAWLNNTRHRLREAAEGPLETSELGQQLGTLISDGLISLRSRCVAGLRQLRGLGGFEKYEQVVIEHGQAIQHWRETFESAGLDALTEVVQVEWPRLPAIPSSVPNKDLAKSIVDRIRDDFKTGPWRDALRFTARQWQDGVAATLPHAEVFLDLVERFGVGYRKAKNALRTLDFVDLERFALKVLREDNDATAPAAAACLCHNRYQHVLVDEYQDINEVQDAILSLVSRECLAAPRRRGKSNPEDEPNLFCVGDVKQSIYRFRLAEPARFLRRLDGFRAEGGPGEVIDLRSNFRSRAPLLEAINGVFERLMTREAADIAYDQSHRLAAGLTFPDPAPGAAAFTGSPIELHLLPAKIGATAGEPDSAEAGSDDQDLDRTEREALFVAYRIRQLMGLAGCARGESAAMRVTERLPDGNFGSRPIRYGDIVVLLRSMRFKAEQFARALSTAGIPVRADSSTGYFDSMEVRDMLSLLRLLDNERQDIPMAAVLRSPLAGLAQPEDALARVRRAYPSEPDGVPFHDAVVRYSKEQDNELAALLRDFLKELHGWRELAQRRPLDELIWRIYQQSGYLAFCSGLAGGEQRVANLLYLHERAAQFGTFQRQGLSRFMQFLESLREETDLGMPSVASGADDAVRVMSIHRAKGLEFPVVILADLGKAINLSDCEGSILVDRSAGMGLKVVDEEKQVRYPSLATTLVSARLRQQSLAEELRVLYVAMTRAREHLICVGTVGEQAMNTWSSRWATHLGPLPADAFLGARCMLDWLGPVAAATQGAAQPIFEITLHTPEDLAEWSTSMASAARGADGTFEHLAALEPLVPPPEAPESAKRLIERLNFRYPYHVFTKVPAFQSVTGRTKGSGIEDSLPAEKQSDKPPEAPLLSLPRFVEVDGRAAAAERGTATHAVLQYLDFGRRCDEADLEVQIASLVDRRILATADATRVDRSAIAWLMNSEVGALLRTHSATLRREIPVNYPAQPEPAPGGPDSPPAEPLDRIMVRGRLDVVIPLPSGGILIDYKTDDVSGDRIDRRADEYRPQVNAYREAISAITGFPIARALLVFLTPRQVREV